MCAVNRLQAVYVSHEIGYNTVLKQIANKKIGIRRELKIGNEQKLI